MLFRSTSLVNGIYYTQDPNSFTWNNLNTVGNGIVNITDAESIATSTGAPVLFLWNPGSAHLGAVPKLYIVTNNLGALTLTNTITPTISSNSCTDSLVWFDNYVFIWDRNGNIYNSNLNDPTTWNGASFFNTNSYNDQPVRLERNLNYLIAFKSYSIDFLYDAGNPTLTPLAKAVGLTIKMGCNNPGSVRSHNEKIYFVAQNRNGYQGIYSLSNIAQLQKISNFAVDRKIKALGGAPAITNIRPFSLDGHTFLMVPQINMMYCVDSQKWVVVNFPNGTPQEIVYSFQDYYISDNVLPGFSTGVNKLYSIDSSNIVNTLSSSVYQDKNSVGTLTNYTKAIQTPRLDFGTNKRKVIDRVELLGDFNGNTISMTAYDDDYQTTSSTGRTISMNYPKAVFYTGGSPRRRAYTFIDSGSQALRLSGIEIEYEVCED